MNIIYASCLCTKDKYNKLFKETIIKPGQQVQKYHRLLVEGLVKNKANVKTVTVLPITKANYPKVFVEFEEEVSNDIIYIYLPLINLPLVKNIIGFINSFFYTFFSCLKDKEVIIIGDVLNLSVCAGALCASKMLKRDNMGIVTDVPFYLYKGSRNLSLKLNNQLIKSFDSYLFLTEDMNKLINKFNKPYIVIEGQVDINMKNIENTLSTKYDKKICIYAGGLQKIYGIKNLIQAFITAKVKNAELHFYGNGDFEDELKIICKKHMNIKYFGVMTNDYVMKEEIRATLLINPRPTNEEYTKYSFPSKNMEYMVSGTPVLTTKLPGMPKDYYSHVYLIEDESVDGLSEALKNILTKSNEELHEKGRLAKEFVLKEKNNIVQAEKILKLMNKLNNTL